MPWPITFRGERPEKPQVGDAYFVREDLCGKRASDGVPVACGLALTPMWERSGRRPITVVLPDGYHFIVDTAYWGGQPNPGRAGWGVQLASAPVVGARLDVTLSPSVNICGSYHGWIQGGVISDDVEGRRFTV